MKILITGCNGQLGNEMQLLAKKNPQHQYFFTDVEELDITDAEAIDRFVQDNQVDCIVNCAAYTAVDKAEENEEFCNLLNNIAPGYLAKAIEKRGGYMVQVSTDYVFDGTNHTPYTEEEPTCPNSVYGRTKLAGEKQVLENCKQSMIIRTAWLYSTFGNNFVKTMIRLGQTKPELGVIFDQIGTPTYTKDLARLLVDMIETDKYGYYHATNEGGYISWYDFCKEFYRQYGLTTKVIPVTTREYGLSKAMRPFNSRLDKSKLAAVGFEPLPDWRNAVKRYLEEAKL